MAAFKNSQNALEVCCFIFLLYTRAGIFGLMLVKPDIFWHKFHMFTSPATSSFGKFLHFSFYLMLFEAVIIRFIHLYLFKASDWKINFKVCKKITLLNETSLLSSMLVMTDEISLTETASRTKSIFRFNNGVLKTLSRATFSRVVARSKKVNIFYLLLMSGL